jgi:hypothetical protein
MRSLKTRPHFVFGDFLMHPSLDPEVFMAKLLSKLAGHDPETLTHGGYDESGTYYPVFAQTHLYDHRFREVPEVFAWRKFVIPARKLIEEMARNGQTIYQARPHYFHGDHEDVFNFRVVIWTDFEPEDFQPAWPSQLVGSLDKGWKFDIAVQARSDKEAVGFIFDGFIGEPKIIRILSLEKKPNDWSPFNENFKNEAGFRWSILPDKE